MSSTRIEKLPAEADGLEGKEFSAALDAFAKDQFGPRARVPVDRWDAPDAPVVGYVETSRGTYAVIEEDGS